MEEKERLEDRIRELERENQTLREGHIEINKAKELYLKIFDEFPALIWRSRLDKLCDYFNKYWLEFTGRTYEQEFGNGWAEGVHPDDLDFCVQTYVTAFERREAFLMEYRLKNRNGEYRWIRDFGRPFYDLDNTFLGYIGSCYDITPIKDNESKLIELNRTKDKFFSIIAHDLKSPFNTIIGFSDQLIERVEANDYEGIGQMAGFIQQSAIRAMDLLNNLMKWGQLQSGGVLYRPEDFDMGEQIHETALLLSGMAGQKSITIENKVSEKLLIHADKEMMGTVLRNLISNALKFTPVGGTVVLSAEAKPDELIVSVRDNGVGIDTDRIGKLFTISDNVSTPGTQQERGTGLGLVLCKEFMDKNRGRIWVESTVGMGTTFYLSLPGSK